MQIVNSLQCLKLNADTICPKYEIVPFLLAVLPNAKSLGHINVLRGLKMIRDIPGLAGIGASNIEEIDIGFGNDQVGGGSIHSVFEQCLGLSVRNGTSLSAV